MRILIVAGVLALVGCTSPASTPSPTPSASIAASPTQASTTRVPIPTAGPGTYTSLALEYRLELPAGWRYSQCQSGEDIGGRVASRHEGFTSSGVDDESWMDATGPAHTTVSVSIVDNPAGRTALQWLSDRGAGPANEAYDRATVDGREGAHVITQAGEVKMLVTAARGRLYAISAGPQGITPDARRIMNSLHILDDAQLATARATLATPAPTAARSAEIVADTVARGFSQKDVNVLATVAWPCISRGFLANNDSVGTASSTRALDDLRKAFAAGLTVVVAPRPVTIQAGGYGSVEATWTEAGRAPRRAVVNLLLRGDTWYWYAYNLAV